MNLKLVSRVGHILARVPRVLSTIYVQMNLLCVQFSEEAFILQIKFQNFEIGLGALFGILRLNYPNRCIFVGGSVS